MCVRVAKYDVQARTSLLRFSVTVVTAAICCRLYGLADVQHAFDESKKIIMLFLVVFVLILYLR